MKWVFDREREAVKIGSLLDSLYFTNLKVKVRDYKHLTIVIAK